MVSVKEADFTCSGLPESVTEMVSGVALTATDDVPVMVPEVLSERPVGRVPVMTAQEYGVFPPLAVSVAV